MGENEYEWDEKKRAANVKEHGIDFGDIPEAFKRPYIEDYDHRHSPREDRWRILGFMKGRVVYFVYTLRGGKKRIITARPANKKEAVLYYSRFWFDSWT